MVCRRIICNTVWYNTWQRVQNSFTAANLEIIVYDPEFWKALCPLDPSFRCIWAVYMTGLDLILSLTFQDGFCQKICFVIWYLVSGVPDYRLWFYICWLDSSPKLVEPPEPSHWEGPWVQPIPWDLILGISIDFWYKITFATPPFTMSSYMLVHLACLFTG